MMSSKRTDYPRVVGFEIEEQNLSSYLRAADFINISNVDLVCLQHELGNSGGRRKSLAGAAVGTGNARGHDVGTVLRQPNFE